MTEAEIDAMPAGPALDALACEAAGIEPRRRGCMCDGQECRSPQYCDAMEYPRVSAQQNHALYAAREFAVRHPTVLLTLEWAPSGACRCVIIPARHAEPYCTSVPLAIARALAKAGLRMRGEREGGNQ